MLSSEPFPRYRPCTQAFKKLTIHLFMVFCLIIGRYGDICISDLLTLNQNKMHEYNITVTFQSLNGNFMLDIFLCVPSLMYYTKISCRKEY